jgi:hypothetical protein
MLRLVLESNLRRSTLLSAAARITALALLLLIVVAAAHGQAAPSKSGASGAGPAGSGFAIESEMLTYRAVESNSETLACDVAAYLYKVPATFDKSVSGSKCTVMAPPGGGPGIILMTFDQNVVDAFQEWRADLEIMDELLQRSNSDCGTAQTVQQGQKGSEAAVPLSSLTPAGAALSLTQGLLGSFATQIEVSAVTGSVQDQAFIDGVARQLLVLGIPVIVPADYIPHALSGIDISQSPFLSKFRKFLSARDCEIDAAGKAPSDKKLAAIVGDMNAFLAGLSGSPTATAKQTNGGTTSGNDGGHGANNTPTSAQALGVSPAAGLAAILLVDGLAQQLGVEPVDAKAPPSRWQHLLFLKALESGGSIIRTTSIFGTRIRYSGGAVGTFALLTREGNLECSGNVFDFGGSVSAKKFERDLHRYTPDLSSQLLFQRGSCPVPSTPEH